MAVILSEEIAEYLETVAARVGASVGQPEAQMTAPTERLMSAAGTVLGRSIATFPESRAADQRVRPDLGVRVEGALTGYVELKAPGKGADPHAFSDPHDRRQWERLRELPNLVYTDSKSWALFRSGERVRSIAIDSLSVDAAAASLSDLLADFYSWRPIVPKGLDALAKVIAPLCRIVRDQVADALSRKGSALSRLAADWRQVLFPEATDAQFADSYAQTLTYALLLARLDPATRAAGSLTTATASDVLEQGHSLLARALRILADPSAREEIGTGVALLERVISVVSQESLETQPDRDVWLYFYETFLAEYDPVLREARGVYYTPREVVQAQVRLVGELLETRLGKTRSYADEGVTLLDPAVGTGTYPLSAVDHALAVAKRDAGAGAVPGWATRLASNVNAFELLVGPYAVAHLRLTQRIRDAGGTLPDDGVKVFLTDTLEAPHGEMGQQLPLFLQRLGDEHERAREVKDNTRILVCIGNPPYERQASDLRESGEGGKERRERLLGEFLTLARGQTRFSHLASLYNDYVYFWRWALRKVFGPADGPGIVSFISAASYLRGPGFLGMREVMRRTLDELWIIDLGGSASGPVKSENVFAITTPVAIAVGVRYGTANPTEPAVVHYAAVEGNRAEKLEELDGIEGFGGLEWRDVPSGWSDALAPAGRAEYEAWPLLIDLFPWQTPGVKLGRTWPVATSPEAARARWSKLATAAGADRPKLMGGGKFSRKVVDVPSLGTLPPPASPSALFAVDSDSPVPRIEPYGYRAHGTNWVLADSRLIDLARPPLWFAHSAEQFYMVAPFTGTLGRGPSLVASADIPDLHFFRGSFGGKDVIPLWRDAGGTEPNVTAGALELLSLEYDRPLSPLDLAAYAYALLGCEAFGDAYRDDVTSSGIRIPLTRDRALFEEAATLGRQLLGLHTRGKVGGPPAGSGAARATKPVSSTSAGYPGDFDWHAGTLRVGDGEFEPVPQDVWEYEISGYRPVRSWLAYRMRKPAGRNLSALDLVQPKTWSPAFTDQLLDLLWTIEATVALREQGAALLARISESSLFFAEEMPVPSPAERNGPAVPRPTRPAAGRRQARVATRRAKK